MRKISENRLIGIVIYIFGCICFALCALPISASRVNPTTHPDYFLLSRYIFGCLFFSLPYFLQKKSLRIHSFSSLLNRGVANYAAVYFFFSETIISSGAQANVYAQSYSVFIIIYSLIFYRNQRPAYLYLLTLFSIFGISLILSEDIKNIESLHLNGLLCSICTAWALLSLSFAREKHSSQTTLAYMFLIGMILCFFQTGNKIFSIPTNLLLPIILSGLLGVLAQAGITYGIKFINETEASVLGSSRVLAAFILTYFFSFEQELSIVMLIGVMILIFCNTIIVSKK